MEIDFKLAKCRDDWSNMDFDKDYISENFHQRFMGILADNTEEIEKVYTAVFINEKVMAEILKLKEKNVLLFTHHPVGWKIISGQSPFINPDRELLARLKENQISIYTLHTPLDRNGEYSTSVNFMNALEVTPEGEFAEYFGFLSGTYGKTNCKTISEIAEKFRKTIDHEVKVWQYGTEEIKDEKVAFVAGGGNDPEILEEVAKLGINTMLTGVTFPNPDYQPSILGHETAKKYEINLIGGTHYSTEKFACIKMLEYFKNLGLPAKFLEDDPDMGDLG
jgi:putative NIF3 family GTP cyclohydrolase 1 type 2